MFYFGRGFLDKWTEHFPNYALELAIGERCCCCWAL